MKKLILFFILIPFLGSAQITLIPDGNFEQHLVFWGYDTDGIVNGQILTVDALQVTELDFVNQAPYSAIHKLDGLNDFINIETLKVGLSVFPTAPKSVDFTNLTKLKKVYFAGWTLNSFDVTPLTALEELELGSFNIYDAPHNEIRQLNFSNSQKIKYLHVRELYDLELINLRNNIADSISVIIELGTSNIVCVEVDDHIAAINGLPPYDTWSITLDGVVDYPKYYFSDKCTLSTENFIQNSFKIYPNPATDYVTVEYDENAGVQLRGVQILDSSGKWVRSVKDNFHQINVSGLSEGVYLFVIQTDKGNKTEKVVVK